jgi:hypothetical protein
MTKKVLTTMSFAAAIASGQRVELGGLIGGGAFAVSTGGAAPLGQAGVEACVFCSGRFSLFGEYSHWFSGNGTRTAFGADRVTTADLAGAGLRIQRRGRVRVFFDIGAVAGRDEHDVIGRGRALGGVVVGTGVGIPWGEHWYIRPQFRAYGLSPHTIEGVGPHWAVSGGVGIGYRF